jgi:hypothetical protein
MPAQSAVHFGQNAMDVPPWMAAGCQAWRFAYAKRHKQKRHGCAAMDGVFAPRKRLKRKYFLPEAKRL